MSLKMALSGSKATAWFLPEQGEMRGDFIFKLPENTKVTDSIGIKTVKWKYYKWFCLHKFNNLNEIDQLFESNKLLKLTQEEIDNLNSPLFIRRASHQRKFQAKIVSLPYSVKHLKNK